MVPRENQQYQADQTEHHFQITVLHQDMQISRQIINLIKVKSEKHNRKKKKNLVDR